MAKIQRFGSFFFLSNQDAFGLVHLNQSDHGWQGSVANLKTTEAKPKDDKQTQKKNDRDRKVTAGAVSSDGKHVAVCDDHKTLSLWRVEEGQTTFSLVNQYNLSTRSDHVLFTQNPSPAIIVADKSGDVKRFPLTIPKEDSETPQTDENGGEGEIILGHLSMLLGVQITPCGKFILTADRDEKLRVSCYPNAYNIHGYCLGHTEFVSDLRCLYSDVAVTASGDGSLRTWNYTDCCTIDKRLCFEDAGVNAGAIEVTQDPDGKLRRAPVPGVRAVKAHHDGRLAVHIECFDGLLMYNCSPEGQLKFERKISLNHPVIDYDFDMEGNVVVLLAHSSSGAEKVIVADSKSGDWRGCASPSFVKMFFKDVQGMELQSLDNYYKRWFDNVLTYQENKEKRMNENKREISESDRNDMKRLCIASNSS